MRKVILLLCSIVLSAGVAFADSCFISKENGKVLRSEGDCFTRYTPESTFKIALSLIGFDTGILKNENNPSWSLPEGVDPYISVCKYDHDPRTWIRDSCLWYSRILTTKLGIAKFQDYVNKFNYGNMDLAGDDGRNNKLTNAWFSRFVEISPQEQVVFLEKPNLAIKHGWFISSASKGNQKIIFANHIVDDKKREKYAGSKVKKRGKERLLKLIEQEALQQNEGHDPKRYGWQQNRILGTRKYGGQ